MSINVLYVSSQRRFIGGAPRSLYEMLTMLDPTKVQPFFASIYHDELYDQVQRQGITGFHIHPRTGIPHLNFFLSAPPLMAFMRKHRIDLVHNNQCGDTLYSLMAGKLLRVPVVIHHRDLTYYRLDRLMIRMADANIAISNWENQNLLSGRGIVIHNGLMLHEYDGIYAQRQSVRREQPRKVRIGVVGRITPVKGQDTLIRAAALVLRRAVAAQFLIFGEAHDPAGQVFLEELHRLSKVLGITEHIEFRGHIEGKDRIWPAIDILVVPSRKEPFGRVAVEAMACGIPVIGSATGGLLDIIAPDTGISFQTEDHVALANAIAELVRDPVRRTRMGREGRKRAEGFFALETTLARLYALYGRLTGYSQATALPVAG